jgi:hypothetical protein
VAADSKIVKKINDMIIITRRKKHLLAMMTNLDDDTDEHIDDIINNIIKSIPLDSEELKRITRGLSEKILSAISEIQDHLSPGNSTKIYWAIPSGAEFASFIPESNEIHLNVYTLIRLFSEDSNKNWAMHRLSSTAIHELTHVEQYYQTRGEGGSWNKTLVHDKISLSNDDLAKKIIMYISYLGRQQEIGARANQLAGYVLNRLRFLIKDQKITQVQPVNIRRAINYVITKAEADRSLLPSFDSLIKNLDTNSLPESVWQRLRSDYQLVRQRLIKQAYLIIWDAYEKEPEIFDPQSTQSYWRPRTGRGVKDMDMDIDSDIPVEDYQTMDNTDFDKKWQDLLNKSNQGK